MQNAWLLAAGLLVVVPLLVLGPEAFVEAVREVYTTRIAQFSPEFRARLLRETQALYATLLVAGTLLTLAWAALSARRRIALVWILGEGRTGWRDVLLLAVIASSSVFVAIRATRDVVRFEALSGLSFEEQRFRLGAESPIEPDYATARAFLDRHGARRGNVLILRPPPRMGAWQTHYIFLAAYLFPVRVYTGTEADLAPDRLAGRGVRWVQREEPKTAFAPEPLEAWQP